MHTDCMPLPAPRWPRALSLQGPRHLSLQGPSGPGASQAAASDVPVAALSSLQPILPGTRVGAAIWVAVAALQVPRHSASASLERLRLLATQGRQWTASECASAPSGGCNGLQPAASGRKWRVHSERRRVCWGGRRGQRSSEVTHLALKLVARKAALVDATIRQQQQALACPLAACTCGANACAGGWVLPGRGCVPHPRQRHSAKQSSALQDACTPQASAAARTCI